MADNELGDLRAVLDADEKFASAIRVVDPGHELAQQMLALIADAREGLRPSGDSTANFIQSRDVIGQLAMLRQQIEALHKGKPA